MNWLIIVVIYCYTIGLLLCFYAGMIFERKYQKPKISARVIRPAHITIVENYEVKANDPCNFSFPNTESNG